MLDVIAFNLNEILGLNFQQGPDGLASGLRGLHQALNAQSILREMQSGDEHACVIVHRGVKPLHVSEEFAAAHGYDAAEILQMPSIEPLWHPDDRPRLIAYDGGRANGSHGSDRCAYRALRRDGSFVWFDVVVRIVQWQGCAAFHCTIIRVRVPDRVLIIDQNYRCVFANEATQSFHEKTRSEIVGRHFAEAIGSEQSSGVSEEDLDRCLAGESLQMQHHHLAADGPGYYFDITLEPFRGGDDGLIGAIAVFRDVTDATNRTLALQLASSAIDQISERVVIVDREENVRLVNQSNLKFHDREAAQIVGKHLRDLIGWECYPGDPDSMIRQAIETGAKSRHEYWRPYPDGEMRYWETSVVPYREADSTISGAIATSRDMTEHRLAEQAKQRFQDAIEHVADGYALFDEEERLVACNPYYQLKQSVVTPGFALGISFEAIVRGRVYGGTIRDAVGREEAWIAERLKAFRAESYFAEFRERCGHWTQVRNRRTANRGTLLVVTDITESKRIEEVLAETQSRFKDFSELAADWFWEQDTSGRYTYVSESIEVLTRRPVSELIGKNPVQAFGSDVFKNPTWQGLWQEMRTTGVDRIIETEHDLTAVDGRLYRARTIVRPIKNTDGVIIGYRGVAKDITEAKRLERELEYHAHHDALTGLLNRRSFERHLDQAIKARTLSHRSAVFCFIDLDQFKVVNDTAGHLAGDRLLQQVAVLLKEKIRKGDVLARLGGDEFGLLLQDCSLRRAQKMANKLLSSLNEDRFVHGESVFEIGASIGLSSITTVHNGIGEVMAEADLACYAAKDDGRNRVQVYQHDDRQLSRRRDEMSKASLIRAALDEGRFVLFAQPIRPLADHADDVLSCEILLRMIGADGSLVGPDSFIPAAERYGLMVEIDRWVIQESFAMLAGLHADHPNAQISINLSGLSLNEGSLVGFIMRSLRSFSIAPEKVCFEITETAAIHSLSKTKSLIGKLRQIGCRFALDDFGTGLSSFNYLKQLPVDYLKIDGSFIRDIESDRRSKTMVEAIHQVAKSLGLQTVAESVETEMIADMLRSIGIDFVQGIAIGRPEPLAGWSVSRRAAG